MFLIDFELKGNVVKLYFGTDPDYWGDDWDDTPWEHNAGTVYDRYVDTVEYFAFPWKCAVLTSAENWCGNSHYSKEDFKRRLAPCVIIHSHSDCEWDYLSFSDLSSSDNSDVLKLYFGDDYETVVQNVTKFGGISIE